MPIVVGAKDSVVSATKKENSSRKKKKTLLELGSLCKVSA